MKRIGFLNTNKLTNLGCLPLAIQKDGRTLAQIMEDISNDKILELKVISLSESGFRYQKIARNLGITPGKVKHILIFDQEGLSYRKLNKKYETKALQTG